MPAAAASAPLVWQESEVIDSSKDPYMFHYWGWGNRSQVQGSTFRVKGKEGVEDPKASLNLIFLSNCQFGSKFWITPDEAGAFVINMHPKCSQGIRFEL